MEINKIFTDINIQFLLKSLDSIQNAISIYDRNLRLFYANDSYCRNMLIDDRAAVIGETIENIMRKSGVKIISLETNREQLALPQVLEYGNTVLDREVKLVKENDPKKTKMLIFDMYPIFDEGKNVCGVIEVSHSRHSDLRRFNKMIGFKAEYTFESILGESEIIKNKIWQAANYAASNFNLHIYGESGVGKELFAQAVHNASSNRKGPFVALNCAAFPENLIESELFGYVGGAFTGASKNGQMSKFELADGGTLFLDEIGEMPLPFQAKLLRVLETNMVTRIGSSTSIPFNVRIISATNRDLEKMVEEGTFRQDLYYRLQVLGLEIPPLRKRGRDVLLIADHFLETIAETSGEKKKSFTPEAETEMLSYGWPGNIRELKNAMNRITILAKGDLINVDELRAAIYSKTYTEFIGGVAARVSNDDIKISETNQTDERADAPEERIAVRMRELEQANINLLQEAMDIADGDKAAAAELLGVSRKTIYNLLHKYNMKV